MDIYQQKKKYFKNENDYIFIASKEIHRAQNPKKKPVKILEAQIGPILRETDIKRFHDLYGRS